MIVLPHSEQLSSLNCCEFALSVDGVTREVAFDGLAVGEVQLAFAFLAVLAKLSLVPAPVVLHLIQVLKIECLL